MYMHLGVSQFSPFLHIPPNTPINTFELQQPIQTKIASNYTRDKTYLHDLLKVTLFYHVGFHISLNKHIKIC